MTNDSAAAYVAPMAVYLLGVSLAASFPAHYAAIYAAVVVLTAVVVGWSWRQISVIRPHGRILPAVVVGLLGIVAWIGLSRLGLESRLAASFPGWLQPQPRVGLDPWSEFSRPALVWGFIAVRMVGLAILVPIAEEVFWRGFLLRWTISERWRDVPVGKFEWRSFLIVTLLFTLVHPEWFAAATYAVLLNGFLYWKKDLWLCIVAHAVSNFALGGYVLSTGSWELW